MNVHLTSQQIEEMKEFANLGFSYRDIAKEMKLNPRTVSKHLGKKYERRTVDNDMLSHMQELRSQGLSNCQIAKETGFNPGTVVKYLGKQKSGVRASYGSIVSHATGDSFVIQESPKQERNVQKVESKLKVVKASISCDGSDFSYRVNTDGMVRITTSTGIILDLTKDQLLNFIAELCELGDWLAKNSESTLNKHLNP